ncbi:restriction endonuclease [Kitasatospora sp. NPDC127060]|uniref:restriction endonuclease n=1 Tax=Kitasatospora sp. NPDC127060 TaxID=3347121 RepID=UPI00365A08FE
MKINRNQAVQPPVYAARTMRKAMGQRIAAATQDDLLAAFLLQEELCMVGDAYSTVHAEGERLTRRAAKAARYGWGQLSYKYAWKTAGGEFSSLCASLARELDGDARAMKAIEHEIVDLHLLLMRGIGSSAREQYTDEARRSSPLDRLTNLRENADTISIQARARLKDATARIGELEITDQRREAYMASAASIGLDHIDNMNYAEFEQLAADLLERDGLTVIRQRGGARDQGADVIAQTPGGHRIVVQCKHRRKGAKIEPQVLYALNGTARPIHRADTVVAMTNRSFTPDASSFGHSQDIHMISRKQLTRWATWGDPCQAILGLPASETGERDQESAA